MDREKVLRGLECCIKSTWDDPFAECEHFPYNEISIYVQECRAVLSADALTLLKEQEAVSAHWDDDTEHWIEGDRDGIDPHTRTTGETIDTFRCSWCGFYQYWKTPFCPNCGAKMEGR